MANEILNGGPNGKTCKATSVTSHAIELIVM
jgi:hypothetical protein